MDEKYFYREDRGSLRRYDGSRWFGWDTTNKKWYEAPNCRIFEPDSDAAFWYDEITPEQAKDIMESELG